MARKQGLGRGLDNIFEENSTEEKGGVVTLRISDVEPRKDQPRKVFDKEALAQLTDSISVHGVLQPIIVRPAELGMYEIIAGERRWRAARQAGLSEIPVLIMEADELKAAQIAIIENIQRENLNPFEEAAAYAELIRTHGMSQDEVATKLGKSRPAVSNAIRLLDLPDEVAELIKSGQLSAGHGRTLLGLKDRSAMLPLANKIIKRNLSVRETEAAVKRENKALEAAAADNTDDTVTVNYAAELESKISSAIGRKVHILANKNRRVVQIEYADNEDLEEIIAKLCGGTVPEV
ncbi:MAG: ParB/RepB/Spo0J family partition protein [Ruminococcaceae bacterium]|nr:ParB/RepB/Spo0J family partition protein [Oscillospiraceae bacterium]